MRGFFEIGVWHPKHEVNLGTLWRSAWQLGAAGIFTVGARYDKRSLDLLVELGRMKKDGDVYRWTEAP